MFRLLEDRRVSKDAKLAHCVYVINITKELRSWREMKMNHNVTSNNIVHIYQVEKFTPVTLKTVDFDRLFDVGWENCALSARSRSQEPRSMYDSEHTYSKS